MRRLLIWWLAGNVVGLVLLAFLPGRASANAHPSLRAPVGPGWY